LSQYYEQHGHSNVPEDYVDNAQLGQWSMNQRTAYKRYAQGEPTALTADRIQLLEEIDFRWNLREHQWYSMQERLKQYYQENESVAIKSVDTANTDLRGWLILQRYHYHRRKKGLPSPLTNQRIEALENAIPNFAWKAFPGSGPSSEDWSSLFDAMRDKGIQPGTRPKQHWFEGVNPQKIDVKNMYTDKDLLELWNEDDEDDDDDPIPAMEAYAKEYTTPADAHARYISNGTVMSRAGDAETTEDQLRGVVSSRKITRKVNYDDAFAEDGGFSTNAVDDSDVTEDPLNGPL
jgi:hypothetical protein